MAGQTMAAKYRKFRAEQTSRRELLESEGADEDMIEKILGMYKDEFLGDIAYERHRADFEIGKVEEYLSGTENGWTEGIAPDENVRFWWLDEIDDVRLHKKLKRCSDEELEIINGIAFRGLSQKEIAEDMGIGQGSVSKAVARIRGKIDISDIRS